MRKLKVIIPGLLFSIALVKGQSLISQALPASVPAPISEVGSLGLAGWVFWLWRLDKKSDEARSRADREADQERYEKLAIDYRIIIQELTANLTLLNDNLKDLPCKYENPCSNSK